MNNIIDITPPLTEKTAVWPGDKQFQRSIQGQLENGDTVYLSSFTTTVHIGAHADAPSHYAQGAPHIDALALEPYLGGCVVMTCKRRGLIQPEDCRPAVEAGAERILFRTLSFPNLNHFNTDFTAFSGEAVDYMGQAGVKLIGIDTPSVDAFDSKSLPAHNALHRWNMRNLEGLLLTDVEDGRYELIALPLKLAGFDGSPLRAILRRA